MDFNIHILEIVDDIDIDIDLYKVSTERLLKKKEKKPYGMCLTLETWFSSEFIVLYRAYNNSSLALPESNFLYGETYTQFRNIYSTQ